MAAVERSLVDAPTVTAFAVQDYGMTVEQVCLRATVCIVGDPARLPMRMQWVLALRGGVAVQPRFLMTKGGRGAAVAYRPAIATPRQLWLSPRFMEKFLQIAVIMQSAAVDQTSKWQLLVSPSVYEAARGRSSGAKVVVVMVREEMTASGSFFVFFKCVYLLLVRFFILYFFSFLFVFFYNVYNVLRLTVFFEMLVDCSFRLSSPPPLAQAGSHIISYCIILYQIM